MTYDVSDPRQCLPVHPKNHFGPSTFFDPLEQPVQPPRRPSGVIRHVVHHDPLRPETHRVRHQPMKRNCRMSFPEIRRGH